jgi:hypothetical protein
MHRVYVSAAVALGAAAPLALGSQMKESLTRDNTSGVRGGGLPRPGLAFLA